MTWKLYSYLKGNEEMSKLLKEPTSWNIILELMTGKFVKSEEEALMCVILSKTEHVLMGN